MMKAINPNFDPERKARVLPFWEELFRLLDRLRSLQLIACPQSDFHEDESAVTPMREDLRHVYEHLSADVRFRDADWIRSSQVFDQVVSWATGKDTGVVNLDRRRVLHGDPSAWTDLYRLSIAMRDPDGYVTELRRSRNARAKSVSPIFGRWKAESGQGKTFAAFFQEEARAWVAERVETYRAYLEKHRAMVSGLQQLGADTSAFDLPSPPPSMPIASAIGQGLERAGVARKDVWPMMRAYCSSDVVERLPFIRVAASLWATFAAQSSTRAEPPGQGLTNDVSIVSTLIPYCDAMFVDRECHGLLNNIPKSHRTTYGCQVFSLINRDAFLEYLREIERAAPAGHLADVAEVYGDSVDRPSVLFKRSV